MYPGIVSHISEHIYCIKQVIYLTKLTFYNYHEISPTNDPKLQVNTVETDLFDPNIKPSIFILSKKILIFKRKIMKVCVYKSNN